MSYIRSTSNPERLYIWGDGKDVHIVTKNFYEHISQKTFDGFLLKYHKEYGDVVTYKGISIKEVWVVKKHKCNKWCKMKNKKTGKLIFGCPVDLKIRLSYKDWHFDMWEVTWKYIANHNKQW
jgi:hypothetical protein